MDRDHDAKLSKLKSAVQALDTSLQRLNSGNPAPELLKIMQRPGWTTPAELIFVLGLVESMLAQVIALEQMQGALLKGSQAVA